MSRLEIIAALKKLAKHGFIEITIRGDAAIAAALSIISKDKVILIPEEGGWLSYPRIPKKLGLEVIEVKCDDAKINLADLQQKLKEYPCGAILYQNPGGYFAEQPMKEIFNLCQKDKCLVIMDVSGSLGTPLCDGTYADILVGSFGEWKLVEAKAGGFVSVKNGKVFDNIKRNVQVLEDEKILTVIFQKLEYLQERISFLTKKRKKIMEDMKELDIVLEDDLGFVVLVKFKNQDEKESIINYCTNNDLPWTECPRYIRLNKPAISIEVKRLDNNNGS